MSAAPDAPPAVNLCLLLGQILSGFGATAQRIHDSVTHLAQHLGCKAELLVSYDALLVTISDGKTYETRIATSGRSGGLNLLGLARVSILLRGLADSKAGPEQIEKALVAIRDTPPLHSALVQVVAAGCAGEAFCIVNGGDPWSWFCSFVVSAFILGIRRPLAARHFNIHVTIFVIALAGSLLAELLARLTHTSTPAIALVAPVLFLVPGTPMIGGGIDIVRNHVTLGLARLGYAMAVLAALCIGVALALPAMPSQTGGAFGVASPWDVMLFSAAGAMAAAALAVLANADVSIMAVCALGGFTARLVRGLAGSGGLDPISATLIGVVCSTLLAGFIANRLRWPGIVVSVMAALPMIPGYFIIDGFYGLLKFAASGGVETMQMSVAMHSLSRAFFICVAIIVGVIGPATVLQRETKRI